jgi:hypothetical protein
MLRAALVAAALVVTSVPAAAQNVEVVPFGGYRFGGSAVGNPFAPVVYDANGGASFGVIVDVTYGPPQEGLKVEALFSRERTWVKVQPSLFYPPVRVDVTVDHLMVGGVQELESGPSGAFLGGLIGLSRYDAPDQTDIRFTVGLSAGAKFFANPHFGLRIDGRGYMTVLSLSGAAVCSGGCVVAFSVNPAFQADLTAGVIIAF